MRLNIDVFVTVTQSIFRYLVKRSNDKVHLSSENWKTFRLKRISTAYRPRYIDLYLFAHSLNQSIDSSAGFSSAFNFDSVNRSFSWCLYCVNNRWPEDTTQYTHSHSLSLLISQQRKSRARLPSINIASSYVHILTCIEFDSVLFFLRFSHYFLCYFVLTFLFYFIRVQSTFHSFK